MSTYLLSQIFAFIAVIFLGLTYLIKDKKIILVFAILFAACYGIQYLILNAITGLLMNIVSVIRNIWFYINAKNKKKNSILVLISLIVISIIFGMISFNNIFSLLPIIATILYTYSIWQDDIKIYRYLAVPISLSWIGYNIYSHSLVSTISECILLIIEIVGISQLKKKAS